MEFLEKLKKWMFGLSPSSKELKEENLKETIRDEMRKKYIRGNPRRQRGGPRDKRFRSGPRRGFGAGKTQRPGSRSPGYQSSRPQSSGRPQRPHGQKNFRRPPAVKPVPKPQPEAQPEKVFEPPKAPVIKSVLVGKVTHYFSKAHAAAVKLENADLKVGDQIQFKGRHAVINITVRSLQVDRVPIEHAKQGEEVGIEVKSHVYQGDEVYKIVR